MKLGSLFSGGKDSTFAIARAKEIGHQVACLISMHPVADDSPLFHYPNSWLAEKLAIAMQIPVLATSMKARSKEEEMKELEGAISKAKSIYGIEGIVHGGISSAYQKVAFEEICAIQNVRTIAPLWNAEPVTYMNGLIDSSFKIIIVGVAALGLGKEWLGTTLDRQALKRLISLSTKFGFSPTFEGGEGETLVIDCPLFHQRLDIKQANVHWDGQRGIFEITEVELIQKH